MSGSQLSIVDQTLLLHLSLDTIEQTATNLLISLPEAGTQLTKRQQKSALTSAHKVSQLINLMGAQSSQLHQLYQDPQGLMKDEIFRLGGQGVAGGDLGEFYERLGKLKEYHRRYPNAPSSFEQPQTDDELVRKLIGEVDVGGLFSGEEKYGAYIDLNAVFQDKFLNLQGGSIMGTWDVEEKANRPGKKFTYLQWLDGFEKFETVAKNNKNETYVAYVKQLYEELLGFSKRGFPLEDVDTVVSKAEKEFEEKWAEGTLPGWERGGDDAGVWCEACQKHYSKRTVYDAHLTSKKHLKASAALQSNPSTSSRNTPVSNGAAAKSVHLQAAKYESLIRSLLSSPIPLQKIRSETKANVERRMALTDRERQAEIEEEEDSDLEVEEDKDKGKKEEKEDEDDDDERIYNPLKLPLGWDGKPIPYWLYKLHGLGVEYRCEICSDHVYMGRKNFERHFQESRHAFGMRALGLPNTRHFHEITRIEDAIALAEKLKAEGKQEVLSTETMEELEDEEGNVYNRKTFEDLRRQGLL
ncbi:hypothetical protein BT69DRAFT_1212906 [Atractiella rhizophila]|nr:hypothetical protein BT69DRAFT_1226017 [Atractiella rhizophila]KAH8928381.1 hypothetical protein BT69DRAFT_1212906 [Atractiella rhizophila]